MIFVNIILWNFFHKGQLIIGKNDVYGIVLFFSPTEINKMIILKLILHDFKSIAEIWS